jgi:hypothetical protein
MSRSRTGRPLFQPTNEQRQQVRTLSGYGSSQEAIARHLGIDPKTLTKHCRDDLVRGVDEANIEVASALFNMATGRKWVTDPKTGEVRLVRCDPVPSACIFWTKARMGWREPPVEREQRFDNSLADATDEELEERLQELKRLDGRPRVH